jgi:hypothetical protein
MSKVTLMVLGGDGTGAMTFVPGSEGFQVGCG